MTHDELRPSVQVRVHPGLCEGWGECFRRAPELYVLDDDGRVDVMQFEVDGEHAEAAFWGAHACPRQAITIIGPKLDYWIDRLKIARTLGPRPDPE